MSWSDLGGRQCAPAVFIVSLVTQHGLEYLFATVFLMGLLQLLVGALRWKKFIGMMPYSVMLGFMNGLAIVIGLAQVQQFKLSSQCIDAIWMSGATLYITLGLVVATMALIWLAPRLTRIIPAPLLAIGVITAVVLGLDVDVPRIGYVASRDGGLPGFSLPAVPLNLKTLGIIFPNAFILAAIGLIESVLTLYLLGNLTDQHGGASQEWLVQGFANFVTGFSGGMGGYAMIGQSMINVKSGGRAGISGIAAAFLLVNFTLFAADLIELTPIAALFGVMFMVVVGTFAWNLIRIFFKVPRADALVIVVVTAVTVIEDLAVAVIVGVIMSALCFSARLRVFGSCLMWPMIPRQSL